MVPTGLTAEEWYLCLCVPHSALTTQAWLYNLQTHVTDIEGAETGGGRGNLDPPKNGPITIVLK